jgi:hypothetical protein
MQQNQRQKELKNRKQKAKVAKSACLMLPQIGGVACLS